jgi:peroxiredoxin
MPNLWSCARRLVPALIVLVASTVPVAVFAAAPSGSPSAVGVLRLSDGSFVSGQLGNSTDPGLLRWQAPLFARPLDFAAKAVDAVTFPAPEKLPRSTGEYCFELSGGDVLFGTLVSLDAAEAVIDVPLSGRLHVRRDAIREFFRWKDGAGLVYQGPNGLEDWTVSPARDAWKHERGQLSTDTPRSFIQSNFALPPRAVVEFEISWTDKPDFILALGMGRDESTLPQAFHVESWLTDLVVLRETAREAEIASLQKLTSDVHRAHFVIYLDQEKGRCLACSTNGKVLADFHVIEKNQTPLSGLRLINRKGDLRLERLRVSHWSGAPPRADVARDKPRIHFSDGTIQYGELASYDAAARSFAVRGSQAAGRPADQIESVFLGKSFDPGSPPLAVAYHDSTRMSGRLLKIENKRIWLACPAVREPLQLPLEGLRSIVSGATAEPLETTDDVRIGILEAEGVKLPGFLVDGVRQKDASCIVWHPRGSLTSSPLRTDADGRIVYHEPPPVRRDPPRNRMNARRVVVMNNGVAIRRIIENPLDAAQPEPSHELTRKALYLMTGDTIPCEVTRIDQTGLTFKSPISDSTFVPHEKIKAVELTLDGRGPVALTRTKRDRLLTLPRMQKGNPPTHLIRSRDGDYLRGRIVEMDDKRLVFEVRMQTQEIPRERISRIIWLHADEPVAAGHAAPATSAVPPLATTRVQAQLEDGNRLTFSPDKVQGTTLSGVSDAIGLCRVALDKVDRLLIGASINEAATRAAYQQWKLQYAQEPQYLQEAGKTPEGAAAGTESMLVGKAAPDFELDMMGGDRFRLSEHKGKIVVLDFWATWCSHCLQSMPELARLHADSAGRDVEVVAVNLEESPDQITTMLDRHQWKIPVALDRDGVVATKYGVTAIPQTIVIGRDGTVARHFIGGGTNVTKGLAESVHGLVSGAAAGSPKTPQKKQ